MPKQVTEGNKINFNDVELETVILPWLKRFQKHLKGESEEDDSLSAVTEQCFSGLLNLQESTGVSWECEDEVIQNVSHAMLSFMLLDI